MNIHGSQIQTLNLQISYDNKLNNATYDALKTLQLNTINSDTSDLANSKLNDIEASISIFFRSIANNFNMAGYNQDVLKEYVPALVYTMYDGYYIYSPYTNTLDNTNENEVIVGDELKTLSDAEILNSSNLDATYKDGDKISGLKPYIFYSCRYKRNNGDDFIITYSLDNYITIQGMIGGEWVFDHGYLLNNIMIDTNNNTIEYRNVKIDNDEKLQELVYDPLNNEIKKCTYIKVNGVKYYKDKDENDDEVWFSIIGGERYNQPKNFDENSKAGYLYYQEAKEFTDRVLGNGIGQYNLSDLTGANAVDENGKTLWEKDEDGNDISGTYKLGNYKIFESTNSVSIEDPESNFNQQRLAVIRYAIEKNLSIAINNYNSYSTGTTNFQMPKLKEDEWEKILNNISIISFLQGLNIGGKIYNGYSIITNNLNREVVNEDSIYMVTDDNYYHRANDKDLGNSSSNIQYGALNLDFEIKSTEGSDSQLKYFIPQRNSTKCGWSPNFRMLFKYCKSIQCRSNR
ncbi:MAG: hypothetical protein HFJ35_05675 [Clostridia bacterium]|nr:hypothetical protein [Clostridia bacterium]